MAGITAQVYGNIAVLENLEKACLELQARAQAKLEEAGQMAKQRAYELAPVSDIDEPGYVHMRDQMYVVFQLGMVKIGNDSSHAIYNELGTSRMRAHPFLVPAWIEAGYWLKEQLRNLI